MCSICSECNPLSCDPFLVDITQEFTTIICVYALDIVLPPLCIHPLYSFLNGGKHSFLCFVKTNENKTGGSINTQTKVNVSLKRGRHRTTYISMNFLSHYSALCHGGMMDGGPVSLAKRTQFTEKFVNLIIRKLYSRGRLISHMFEALHIDVT